LEERAYREHFELEDRHWWFVGRRAVIRSLLGRADVPREARILDAGCGTGRNLLELSGLGRVEGVDSSPDAIEFCRRRGLSAVTQARLDGLPFVDRSFDLIVMTDVLEHVEGERDALRELRRVAAPRARLLLTVPAYQWLWSQHDDEHHHVRRYTLARLRASVRAAGWEPLLDTHFNSLLLAPIAVIRLATRQRPPRDGRPDLELGPRAANRALARLMGAEAALIARGVSLPAGVSIGMVCVPSGSRSAAATAGDVELSAGAQGAGRAA
jgi:SAM-dependent methyltransferase